MADIFISYARENRDAIRPMAQLLVNKGWSVWWDPDMVPGWHFANVIQQEILAANCIIVAWTKESVKSEWVWNEAQEGKNRNVLLPVLFEKIEPPLGFRHMHVAKLIDWHGEEDHKEVQQLINAVEGLCGRPSGLKQDTSETTNITILESTSPQEYEHSEKDLVLTLPDKPSIAVLPFDNLSADPEQEYFSDGITEDLITDLSKISGLFVISRHSSFVYKGKSVNARHVSRNLGVRYVLEGSVRKVGERIRITAQLIDATQDAHVWADRFDRQMDDIFVIQDEVSRKIVNALKVNLTDLEEQRLGHQGTENIEAHDILLRAKEQFYLFTPKGIANALELYSHVIEIDPNNAQAYAWKSRCHIFPFAVGFNFSLEETIIPGLESAKKAVELDDLLPFAHASLGWTFLWNREIDQAISEGKCAIILDPNFAHGYMWLSIIFSSAGKGDEALESIEKAIRLNPHYDITYLMAHGMAYFVLGQYEKALSYFIRGVKDSPNYIPNHIFRTGTLGMMDRKDEARLSADNLVKLNPNYHGLVSTIFNNQEMADTLNKGLNKAGLDTHWE